MKKYITTLLALTLMLSALAGCGQKSDTVEIKATDNGWDSQMLHNAIAKLVVENAYDGYTFSTSTASSTMNWQAMIAGDIDLDIESWTDNVATYPDDVANNRVVDIGVLVPDSKQGFYVPRYVIEGDPARGIEPMAPDLKTVADLKNYPDVFPDDEDKSKGRIYGAIPGWMADEVLHNKYLFYGLDETFNYARLGSEATLFASLNAAYNLGDAWVGYCYEPTWISGKLSLVLLEDAPYDKDLFLKGECAFPSQELKIVSSNKFAEKAPDLVEFFNKYKTGSEVVGAGLVHIMETGASHEDAAKWLLKEYPELLDQWLPKDRADRVRKVL